MYTMLMLSKLYVQASISMSLKGILSKGKLSALEFIFPPLNLQTKFAEFVKMIEQQKAIMQQSLDMMEMNYKALMQEYFG